MNDPKLIFDKLESLVNLAPTAETEFEKASLFAAISLLIDSIEKEDEERKLRLFSFIERIRSSALAILGYDIADGNSNDEHLVQFFGALSKIRHKFGEQL